MIAVLFLAVSILGVELVVDERMGRLGQHFFSTYKSE